MKRARNRVSRLFTVAVLLLASCGRSAPNQSSSSTPAATSAPSTVTGAKSRYTAEIWVDNWYSLYINDELVAQDREPLTQERSFNADTIQFSATRPFTIALVTRDYTEGSSGLEYIGTSRQQMGDGGFIAQITDESTGEKIAVSDETWKYLVIESAPLNQSCVEDVDPNSTCKWSSTPEPTGWRDLAYNDAAWSQAKVFSASQVRPKGGYDEVAWDQRAALLWSTDLLVDNAILWRKIVS